MDETLTPQYDDRGLIPAIIQDTQSHRVLMMGWMNAEAFELTRQTGQVHFWSRSRQELWRKGATSGNTLQMVDMLIDCDNDTLLVLVHPAGPTCHTGNTTCFFRTVHLRGGTVK